METNVKIIINSYLTSVTPPSNFVFFNSDPPSTVIGAAAVPDTGSPGGLTPSVVAGGGGGIDVAGPLDDGPVALSNFRFNPAFPTAFAGADPIGAVVGGGLAMAPFAFAPVGLGFGLCATAFPP